MKTFVSDISGKEFPIAERVSGSVVRKSLMTEIQKDHPDFSTTNHIAMSELNKFRERYITTYLGKQMGELSQMEEAVIESINNKSVLTSEVEENIPLTTMGQRVADKVATFGGSWTFIIFFGFFILLWISVNVLFLAGKGFDPYPFILLNLILSCLAAFQAPVIMMSQNRKDEKDRDEARKDYMVNLKSELEIRTLHEKIDHLIMHQQQELLEIQKVQIEMMNDILDKVK